VAKDPAAADSPADDDAGGAPSKGLAAVKAIANQSGDDATETDAGEGDIAPAAQVAAKIDAATQVTAKAGGKAVNVGKGLAAKAEDVDAPAAANAAASLAESGDDAIAAAADAASGAGQSPATPSSAAPKTAGPSFAEVLASAQGQSPVDAKPDVATTHVAAPQLPPVPREAQFAEANHAQIVTGIQAQLLPNGGSMQLHLNPGELGSMSVSVQMRNGVMSATFEASNDQAARLLTHSLGQLKTALETQGVSVGALHVQQAPRTAAPNPGGNSNSGENSDSSAGDKSAQQQEQQRKEMLRKMWRRLNGGKDPLDMVA
jgi:flagellar hook-length control protein FliK